MADPRVRRAVSMAIDRQGIGKLYGDFATPLDSCGPTNLAIPAPDLKPAGPTLDAWVTPVAGQPLTFHTAGQPRPVELVPLYRVMDERYAVYWKFA